MCDECTWHHKTFLVQSSVLTVGNEVILYNIHYITSSTHHCHANILPSTGQENNIAQLKTDKWFLSFVFVFHRLTVV